MLAKISEHPMANPISLTHKINYHNLTSFNRWVVLIGIFFLPMNSLVFLFQCVLYDSYYPGCFIHHFKCLGGKECYQHLPLDPLTLCSPQGHKLMSTIQQVGSIA